MSDHGTVTLHPLRRTQAERHARQGTAEAFRMFDVITTLTDDEDTVAKIGAAVERVEQGPAPDAFKTAFATTMTDLLTVRFGG